MWLWTTTRVGRSCSAWAECSARSTSARSFASATSAMFQPYATNRAATSSVNVMSVWPSMVTRLES